MAAYRKISITFWADSFIQSLTPEGKYFYLYLMTNTRTTQCGIYEITISQICFETGYNQETVNKLLKQFESYGKIKYSKQSNEIALKNWPKYNESTSPKVRACVEKELKSVKNRVLIEYLYSMDTHPQETKEETKEETKKETTDDFYKDGEDAFNQMKEDERFIEHIQKLVWQYWRGATELDVGNIIRHFLLTIQVSGKFSKETKTSIKQYLANWINSKGKKINEYAKQVTTY